MGLLLRYDRLDTGELVALHTHEGRTVAAIVHPERQDENYRWARRWSLAGDVDPAARPHGHAMSATTACGEAAEALGQLLGIEVDGWTVGE